MSIHPLTPAKADRLFWRQEWTRHWPVWLNGLALWLGLFLIPGPTAEESEVLRLSILWTGALALALGGDDIRRGIDPLVRSLPFSPDRRWRHRTLTVLAGGCGFYLAGIIAAGERWAWRLWQPVATGAFVGERTSAPPGFEHWQALGILCLIGVVLSMVAANYRSRLGSVLATLGIVLTALVFGGKDPIAANSGIWYLRRTVRFFTSSELQATIIGVIAWISALIFWKAGSRIAHRRAPITSTAQAPTTLVAVTGVAGILIAFPFVATLFWTWHNLETLQTYGYPSRFWHLWGTAEMGLFGLWWWYWRRATLSWQAKPLSRWVQWLGPAAASLAAVHLVAQPVHLLNQVSRHLRSPWPAPAHAPMVTTTQSWDEAESQPRYSPPPTALDVIVWSHYVDRKAEPIALATTVLPLPASLDASTTSQITFDPTGANAEPLQIELKLRWVETSRAGGIRFDPVTGAAVGRDLVRSASLNLEARKRQSGNEVHLAGSGFVCMAVFGTDILRPERRRLSTRSGDFPRSALQNFPASVGYSVALLPQRPGQPAISRPFQEAVLTDPVQPVYVETPSFSQGIWGLDGAFTRLGQSTLISLILPGFVLGGFLLLRSRFGSVHLLAATFLFLIACSWADRQRIQKERALSRDLSLFEYQRDFARGQAAISYFHKTP